MTNIHNACIMSATKGPNYDAAAAAFFAAMTGNPPVGFKTAISDYCKAIRTAGAFTTDDFHYILAAFDAQQSLLNLINPASNPLITVSAPTLTQYHGYAGNGTTSYLKQTLNASALTKYTQNDAHLGYYNNTELSSATACDIGYITSSTTFAMAKDNLGKFEPCINSSIGDTPITVASAIGYYIMNRTASNATEQFKNGSSIGTGTDASTTIPAEPLCVDNSSLGKSTRQIAIFHGGSHLTSAQVSARNTAVTNLLSALLLL